MNEEQLEQIKITIKESIDKTVNGKINALTLKVDNYIAKDDERWVRYEPYMEGVAHVTGGAKIIVWLALGVSAILGAILAVKQYFK